MCARPEGDAGSPTATEARPHEETPRHRDGSARGDERVDHQALAARDAVRSTIRDEKHAYLEEHEQDARNDEYDADRGLETPVHTP